MRRIIGKIIKDYLGKTGKYKWENNWKNDWEQ